MVTFKNINFRYMNVQRVMITSHGENMHKKCTVKKIHRSVKSNGFWELFYILYDKHLYFCYWKKT